MYDWLDRIRDFLASWLHPAPAPDPGPAPEPTPVPEPAPPPARPSTGSQVLGAINAQRISAGLSALVEDQSLTKLATSWASSMASAGAMDHGDFASRIESVYPNIEAAENIAEGQPDPESVVAAWMDDEPHRANILGDFDHLGVGIGRDEQGSIYWCADFGRLG